MKNLNTFFSNSHYFWVVSRIILILLGTVSLIGIALEGRLDLVEWLVNMLFSLYVLFMFINAIKELRGIKKRNYLNTTTGIFSILIGIAITIVIFFIGSNKSGLNDFVAICFSLWMIGMGIFDFCCKKMEDITETVISEAHSILP